MERLEGRALLTWLAQIGGTGQDYSRPEGNVVDDAGNTYVTGRFKGTADFDPGPGAYNLVSDATDVFIAKYSSSGALDWARRFDGAGDEFGRGITVDGTGVYVTGEFAAHIFVAKLDSETGETQWAHQIGPGRGLDVVAGGGHVYIAGEFHGTVDFDPGSGTENLTAQSRGTGKGKGGTLSDGFVLKLDTAGEYVNAWNFGGTNSDSSRQIILDGDTLFVSGLFRETADFDPSSNTANRTSAGGSDRFFASYTTSGNLNWVQSIGSATNDDGVELGFATDASHLYLAGGFSAGTYDLDPTNGVLNLTSTGQRNAYIARYFKADGFIDASFAPKQLGGDTADDGAEPTRLVLDSLGAIYVSGYYGGNVDLDPGPGVASPPPSNGGYVVKLNATGDYINHWAISEGHHSNVVRVLGDTIYVVGALTSGVANFPNGESLTTFGGNDVYVLAFDQISHDVAVTGVNVPGSVVMGDPVTVSVAVVNQGLSAETFVVKLTDDTDTVTIGTQSVTLAAGSSAAADFTWDTTTASLGDHELTGEVDLTGDEVPANNSALGISAVVDQASTIHVGNLEGSGSPVSKGKWDAMVTILVHDTNDQAVDGATVSGTWSNGATGSSSCITGGGQCTVSRKISKKSSSVTFTVDDVTHATDTYVSGDNHNPIDVNPSIVVFQATPLHLASHAANDTLVGQPLTAEMLNPVVQQAIASWTADNMTPEHVTAFDQLDVRQANLDGTQLGAASGRTIWIDRDAAGYGWSTDGFQGVDLLTVIEHELGHLLGLDHSHDQADVMAATLPVGTRRLLPGSDPLESALDLYSNYSASVLVSSGLSRSTGLSSLLGATAADDYGLVIEGEEGLATTHDNHVALVDDHLSHRLDTLVAIVDERDEDPDLIGDFDAKLLEDELVTLLAVEQRGH